MARETADPVKVEVMFADKLWEPQMQADFVSASITDRLDAADECLLTFDNENFRYHGHKSLAPATPVEVRLGWGDKTQAVFYGEIMGTELSFPREGPPRIQVKAFDRLFRLMRKKQQRTLLEMTDSEVAEKIASEHGLKSEVDSTSARHPYLLQSGESDWEFISMRAAASGRVVRVENKTLTFKDATKRPDPARTLALEADMPALRLDTTIEAMPSSMVVQGWDPVTKKKIEGKAALSDVPAELKTTKLGADISKTVFGDAEWLIQNVPVDSVASAEQLAKSELREAIAPFVTGKLTIAGDAVLRAGNVVELTGLGERLSGNYAIEVSHHQCDDHGYTTTCELVRNGWIPPPPKPPKEEEAKQETIDIEVQVVDSLGNPMGNTPYVLTLSDGSVRKGQTDSEGKISESKCPKGPYKIELEDHFISVLGRE